nr:MAG: hypothetical protein [Bacteriophage sp.]
MDIVRKTFKYLEDEEEKYLYIEAKLTMKVLLLVREYLREQKEDAKIQDIFDAIKNLDAKVMAQMIINSIQNEDADKEKLIPILDLAEAIDLLGKIISKSMPGQEEQEEEMFEDDPEDMEDWDFSFMDYIWNCVLKRNDSFYDVTPKTYFNMIEHHKKFNGIKDNKEDVEYI